MFIYGYKNNQEGFTLIELLVSIALFAVIVLIATSVFMDVSDNQQNAIASQSVQDSLRFTFETLSKEMRNAKSYQNGKFCGIMPYYKTYNITGDSATTGIEIYFQNQSDECVHYYQVEDPVGSGEYQLWVSRGNGLATTTLSMTPDDINIVELYFNIDDDESNSFQSKQPKVTMKMEAEMKKGKKKTNQNIVIHTTVSSRGYYIED